MVKECTFIGCNKKAKEEFFSLPYCEKHYIELIVAFAARGNFVASKSKRRCINRLLKEK